MSAQHTPGPWRLDVHKNVMYRDGMVAFPCISGGFPQEANGRLIAASPELLAALLPFAQFNSSEETITIIVRTADVARAREAIAKAMGAEKRSATENDRYPMGDPDEYSEEEPDDAGSAALHSVDDQTHE